MSSLPVPLGKPYTFSCPQCNAKLSSPLPEQLTAVSCEFCSSIFLVQRPAKKGGKATKNLSKRRGGSSVGDSSSADAVSVDSQSTVLTGGSSNWSVGAQPLPLSLPLIMRNDDTSTEAIISAFEADALFKTFSKTEMLDIETRDEEDGEKLSAGIALAIAKGVLPAAPAAQKAKTIDVIGKSADAVAGEIVAALGDAPTKGCVVVLQGLSGTGKGTTVAKLQETLPRATCWSNGNVFRALTLLAVSYCEQHGVPFGLEALTPGLISALMTCLKFGKYNGKFDIHICGHGVDALVSEIANTTLKEPRVGKSIPTVAKMTQGEVILFAAAAAETMRSDGLNVLMEGRKQTLDYVETPHRFELVLSDPLVIGMRRAAQRMIGGALTKLQTVETRGSSSNDEESVQLVLNILQAELAAMAVTEP